MQNADIRSKNAFQEESQSIQKDTKPKGEIIISHRKKNHKFVKSGAILKKTSQMVKKEFTGVPAVG